METFGQVVVYMYMFIFTYCFVSCMVYNWCSTCIISDVTHAISIPHISENKFRWSLIFHSFIDIRKWQKLIFENKTQSAWCFVILYMLFNHLKNFILAFLCLLLRKHHDRCHTQGAASVALWVGRSLRVWKVGGSTEKLAPAASLVSVHHLRPRTGLVGPVSV